MSHPSKGAIYIGGPRGGKTAKAIAAKAQWSLDVGNGFDASAFGSMSKTWVVGPRNTTATFQGSALRCHPELDWIEDAQVRVAVEIGIAALRGEVSLDD